jgi:serine/threonine-protein kinase HipA
MRARQMVPLRFVMIPNGCPQNELFQSLYPCHFFLNSSESPYEDRLKFMKVQVVFWLLAAIDGHAKNFSIFITPGGYKLTPIYDVISASPYPQLSEHKIKFAMAVGNKKYYCMKQIQLRHFYQTGQKAGLYKEDLDDIFSDLVNRIDGALEAV